MRTVDSGNVSNICDLLYFYLAIPQKGYADLDNDQYGLKCKFGRFGVTTATYLNKTTILCLTPNIEDDPSDISTETVPVTVAMNGVDFNDDESDLEYSFNGTGGRVSTWVIIMGTIIFGLLIVSVLIFLGGHQEFITQRNLSQRPT